ISKEGDILDLATELNLIQKSGTWFSYGDTRLGQGRENVKRFLKEEVKILAEMEAKVRESLGFGDSSEKEEEKKDKETESAN
ncbi:MAG: DNA recombination/repair protein RecA, partial [Calditrichia bacterium]|nr:DNA recombination/repair protein RecA [Calditrichia bacterium]